MKPKGSYLVTRSRAILLLILFVGSLIAVGLLVYFLTDRPTSSPNSAETATSQGSPAATPPKAAQNIRLPRAVIPHHYDVRLFPILEKGNFSILGRVSIDVECKEETDRIVLHSVDIVVDPKSVRLVHHGKKEHSLTVDDVEYDTSLEFLIVRLSQKGGRHKLAKGVNYTLSMDFVGNLTDRLKGLYRSSYKENGEEKCVHCHAVSFK